MRIKGKTVCKLLRHLISVSKRLVNMVVSSSCSKGFGKQLHKDTVGKKLKPKQQNKTDPSLAPVLEKC